ncbi:hypothetical protein HPB47_020843 [Ixodes persulcatus]|uniref:Uncharacterized protein n=1 Tax=Ixodes persulcatus TaxID=34615 RepID=A0AC60QE76_IXOPE|nr:hypothetical protein HPB47_020843 [Ixodes persulcatus]
MSMSPRPFTRSHPPSFALNYKAEDSTLWDRKTSRSLVYEPSFETRSLHRQLGAPSTTTQPPAVPASPADVARLLTTRMRQDAQLLSENACSKSPHFQICHSPFGTSEDSESTATRNAGSRKWKTIAKLLSLLRRFLTMCVGIQRWASNSAKDENSNLPTVRTPTSSERQSFLLVVGSFVQTASSLHLCFTLRAYWKTRPCAYALVHCEKSTRQQWRVIGSMRERSCPLT